MIKKMILGISILSMSAVAFDNKIFDNKIDEPEKCKPKAYDFFLEGVKEQPMLGKVLARRKEKYDTWEVLKGSFSGFYNFVKQSRIAKGSQNMPGFHEISQTIPVFKGDFEKNIINILHQYKKDLGIAENIMFTPLQKGSYTEGIWEASMNGRGPSLVIKVLKWDEDIYDATSKDLLGDTFRELINLMTFEFDPRYERLRRNSGFRFSLSAPIFDYMGRKHGYGICLSPKSLPMVFEILMKANGKALEMYQKEDNILQCVGHHMANLGSISIKRKYHSHGDFSEKNILFQEKNPLSIKVAKEYLSKTLPKKNKGVLDDEGFSYTNKYGKNRKVEILKTKSAGITKFIDYQTLIDSGFDNPQHALKCDLYRLIYMIDTTEKNISLNDRVSKIIYFRIKGYEEVFKTKIWDQFSKNFEDMVATNPDDFQKRTLSKPYFSCSNIMDSVRQHLCKQSVNDHHSQYPYRGQKAIKILLKKVPCFP